MIPQETVNKILDTAQIVDVISDFVTLKRHGKEYAACCPFHNEKTPSFYVNPAKEMYYCFGCHKGGSAIGFVMEYEHLTYAEALRYLAKKYHIEVVEEEETPEQLAAKQHTESLMVVSEFAQQFFTDSLQSEEGKTFGLQYFHARGLEDATIAKYGLGWAPASRHALLDAARAKGYKDEYLEEVGLCTTYEDENGGNPNTRDSFFERVTFPIHSVGGRVIAFGARTLKTEKTIAKYKNSKESPIYVKNKSLYGIWFAKNEIARQGKCFLVEGYLDVLSMHQLGITNVVASSGTSLTEGQIRLIKRFAENVTIMYDGDSAGIHAALRGIGMFLREGMNVKVVLLPDGDDPDSYARKHTLEEVQDFIAQNEQDFISFKSDLLMEGAGNDPLKRAEVINDIADTIADIPDAVKRSVYADACARKFGIDVQVLFGRIHTTREKQMEEERKERERERARRDAGLDPAGPDAAEAAAAQPAGRPDAPQAPRTLESLENNPVLGKAERDLISFILTDGTSPMCFESDSEFYTGDDDEQRQTVFDFISAAMGDTPFANTLYQKVYESYSEPYLDGYQQHQIVKHLLDSPDRDLAFAVTQLSEQRYELTVSNFENAMMSRSSWLVKFVPRAILVFQKCRVEERLNHLHEQLAQAAPEEQLNLLKAMIPLQNTLKSIKSKLGRE